MGHLALHLSPVLLSWKNDLWRRPRERWIRRAVLLSLALGFWWAIYWTIKRVLLYFQAVYGLGAPLASQLLTMILLTFLSLLLFSNLITALSTFFLARDLDLVMSAPTAHSTFFYARLITTTVNSSWMVLFFSLPVFAAYGSVFHGTSPFYLSVILVLPLFLTIPAALGILAIHLLVYLFPARRVQSILFFIGLFALTSLYLLFRFSRPEQLVRPEAFGHFLEFLTAMDTPSSPFLPSSWAAEILAGTLFQRPVDLWFFYPLLASYALFLPLVACWVSGGIYLAAWSKAQESKQGRRQSLPLESTLNGFTSLFPLQVKTIMLKDIKTFLRDTTQWSQLFLLLALVVVYIYNFRVLPLDRFTFPTSALATLVSFANLGLAGFVISAVALRFAFPSVSLEGKAFWIVQTSPLSCRALLWSKFLLYLLPLLLLAELLVYFTNLLLRVPGWMMTLSLITISLLTLGITAIGVGIGAVYPKFHYEHVAEIPTGFGGVICMILSMSFVGFVVIVEAWPVYLSGVAAIHAGGAGPGEMWPMVLSLSVLSLLTFFVVTGTMRLGLKRLEAMRG